MTIIKAIIDAFSECDDEIGAQEEPKALTFELLHDIRSLTKDEVAILDSCKKPGTKYDEQRQKLFIKCFKTWADAANAQEYSTARPRNVQQISDALTRHIQNLGTSPLSGKRLAITASHHCALVPEESHEGDIVAMLVNCYKHAVFRPKQVNDAGRLDSLITSSIEQANIFDCPQGPMRAWFRAVDDDDYDEWMSVWEKAAQSFPI